MPNATFVLKEPNKDEQSLVYLIYRFNNQKLKYSTGQEIYAKFWNTEKQRAKETKSFPEYAEFKSYLNKIETNINNIFRKCLNDEISLHPDTAANVCFTKY